MRFFAAALFTTFGLAAADSEPTQAQIDEIIRKFAAKEADFAKARENYTYRQSARILELDEGGNPIGRWEMISDIDFTREGKRTEKVVRAPVPSLKNILLTPEDLEDLRSVQPFVLTTAELPNYHIRYLGKQTLDEISCYVFAVRPKQLDKTGKRYFAGQVWVDDQDLQIVKSYGRATGYLKKAGQAFPKFETYREQIDGKYWFPTYTIANDTLHFENLSQRIRQTVRYDDYKQFKADVKITFGEEVEKPTTPPKPDPKKPEPKKP